MPDEATPPAAPPPKTVVVGVRADQTSGDLLTWTLLNFALPGDTVVALHAAPTSHRKDSCAVDPAALLSTVNSLNSIIAHYDAFCALKQLRLTLKLVRGPSARSLLVREAASLSASALVLGASASLAKHCRKKLPGSCSVLAVTPHGKVVYGKHPRLDNKNSDEKILSEGPDTDHCPVCLRSPKSAPAPERAKASVVRWALSFPGRAVKPAAATPELEALRERYANVCRVFSYQELALATANFSAGNVAGKGGSSSVYKGRLTDGREVAVKILKHTEDSVREFTSEVEIITTLRHNNIVSLIGFCVDGGNENLMLVYDFLSRGTLDEVLHGERRGDSVISWTERFKIAVGVAQALDYLHIDNNSQPVIHRDVKSSNILLPDDLEPQLCDFGISRWASSSSTHVSRRDFAGTFGYLAPEYFMYGNVDEKVDVYAYGVVLLELISGRKPVSLQSPKNRESLVMWAKPILQDGKVKQLVDPRLGDEYDYSQMERMALAASLCIRQIAQSRPYITPILKLLQGGDDTLKWARSEIGSGSSDDLFGWDDETSCADSDIQSHINLALLDIDDETTSVCSMERSVDYLQGR